MTACRHFLITFSPLFLLQICTSESAQRMKRRPHPLVDLSPYSTHRNINTPWILIYLMFSFLSLSLSVIAWLYCCHSFEWLLEIAVKLPPHSLDICPTSDTTQVHPIATNLMFVQVREAEWLILCFSWATWEVRGIILGHRGFSESKGERFLWCLKLYNYGVHIFIVWSQVLWSRDRGVEF